MTVTEAAAAIGRSPVYVRSLLAKTDGKGPPFRGVKCGPLWMVYLEDVKAFSPRPAGRPRKTPSPAPVAAPPARKGKAKAKQAKAKKTSPRSSRKGS
jgi:hypothetical protein